MADYEWPDLGEKLILLIEISRKEQLVCPSAGVSCFIPQFCVEIDGNAADMVNGSHAEIELVTIQQVFDVCYRARSNILSFEANENSNLRRIFFAEQNSLLVISVECCMQIVWRKMLLRSERTILNRATSSGYRSSSESRGMCSVRAKEVNFCRIASRMTSSNVSAA